MAQGDLKVFEEFSLEIGKKKFDLSTDTIKVMLCSDTTIAADQLTPVKADFTECSVGGSYTGPVTVSATWTELGGLATFNVADPPTWSKAASSPTDIRWAVFYSDTATNKDAFAFVDMRSGGNPISMVDADVDLNIHANGLFTITVSNP